MIRRLLFVFLALLLLSTELAGQTPKYPGSVATLQDLLKAYDRMAGELGGAIDASTLSIPVANGAPFTGAEYFSVTIDDERILICSVSGNTLNVCPGGRGFAGSTAAPHSAGAPVRGNVTAWHHNALVAEIIATQTALGPNLSNVVAQLPFLISTEYDFEPQAPGGSLTAGVEATVTLSPVPLGVNGSDVEHYLYISGGNGTPEAVLITGGTAVSGAESGTIKFTPAHDHSGEWTIRSATAGIQEAVNHPGYNSTVVVPPGLHRLYGPVRVAGSHITITGTGAPQATTLSTSWTSSDLINISPSGAAGGQNWVRNLHIFGEGSGVNYAIRIENQNSSGVDNVVIDRVAGGILVTGPETFRVLIDNVNVSHHLTHGIHIMAGANHFLSRLIIVGYAQAGTIGISISRSGGTWIRDTDVIACDIGLDISPSEHTVGWMWVSNSAFDASISNGIWIHPTGTGKVRSVNFVNCWTVTTTQDDPHSIKGNGFLIDGDVDGVRFIGHRFFNNKRFGGILWGGTNIVIESSVFAGNTGGGLYIQPGVSRFYIRNNVFGPVDGFGNVQNVGIDIALGASDHYAIENNVFLEHLTARLRDAGTGQNAIVRNNVGYNPVGPKSITVGSSPFTYRAGHSPETVYIRGGTVSDVQRGGITICSATKCQVDLPPNGTLTVTYTSAPTMVKDVH